MSSLHTLLIEPQTEIPYASLPSCWCPCPHAASCSCPTAYPHISAPRTKANIMLITWATRSSSQHHAWLDYMLPAWLSSLPLPAELSTHMAKLKDTVKLEAMAELLSSPKH